MAAISDRRQSQVSVDLGGEQVVLENLSSIEPLSLPFRMDVNIIASHGDINMLPHIGKPIAVHAYEDDKLMRHFHGLITSSSFTKESAAGFHYQLKVRSFAYYLNTNSNMAIFQDMTVPDIIKKVLDSAPQAYAEFKLSKKYPKREYCVQYRESDLTFLTRLMEEEGIYYFFKHTANRHTMVLCDMPSAHETASPSKLVYNSTSASNVKSGSTQRGGSDYYLDSISEMIAGDGEILVTLRSFDFRKPDHPLEAYTPGDAQNLADVREIYDYPGNFLDEPRGAALSEVYMAGLRRKRIVYDCSSEAISLEVGTKLTLAKCNPARFNRSYLISGTHCTLANEQYYSAHPEEHPPTRVEFNLIPDDVHFHMPRATQRPVVHGLESAVVSGPDGEEIYTDDGDPGGDGKGYGRVKVRFHWDRSGTPGKNSTCWIRVAQFGNLGSVILPRVDQEVMVAFLNGDPDQPIVMGWMFNKSHMPVYDLPANKTRTVFRTKRYGDTGQYPNAKNLDTGAPGVNELRFEDKGGSEEVFLHAERDMNTRIRFAESHHVGQDQQIDIGHDRTTEVHGQETTTIDEKETHHVKGDQEVNVDCSRIVTIKADDELDAKQSLTIKVGTKMEVTANTSITLTCGQSSIKLEPGQITIQGTIVTVQGTGQAKVTSPMTTVEGTGMNKITGGMVMIN